VIEECKTRLEHIINIFPKTDYIIIGCTELSMIVDEQKSQTKIIEPLRIMAKYSVKKALE